MGVVNIFEAARASKTVKAILNVTSDKCYENQEREAGYKENEPMGGYDPYSASKGCSELISASYRKSFFEKENILLATARAGNVIGGGDWSNDRLVPDIVRSVVNNEKLIIRNPRATRPWQHVLEPVTGYLKLVELMYTHENKYAEGFNFGPDKSDHSDVENIIIRMNKHWNNKIKYEIIKSDANPHEAHFLSLDCSKAKDVLGWKPKWNLDKALQMTVEWNENRLQGSSVAATTLKQITEYEL
jgi:CDP-glucose 4,6-dehydratase